MTSDAPRNHIAATVAHTNNIQGGAMTDTQTTLFPTNLRPADVTAKIARVTLKDTIRVLFAVDAVLAEAGISFEEFMDANWDKFSADRASPEAAAACEQFYSKAMSGESGADYERKLLEFTSEKQAKRLTGRN